MHTSRHKWDHQDRTLEIGEGEREREREGGREGGRGRVRVKLMLGECRYM